MIIQLLLYLLPILKNMPNHFLNGVEKTYTKCMFHNSTDCGGSSDAVKNNMVRKKECSGCREIKEIKEYIIWSGIFGHVNSQDETIYERTNDQRLYTYTIGNQCTRCTLPNLFT